MTLFEEYQEELRMGFDKSTLLVARTNQRDQLRHNQNRLLHLKRAFELRGQLGLPEEVESGWVGDPNSKTRRDRIADEIKLVEGEIQRLKIELGRPD